MELKLIASSVLVYLADRLIKLFFLSFISERVYINGGISFGLFQQYNQWWAGFSLIVIIILGIYGFYKCSQRERIYLSIIIAGLAGNLTDRLYYHGVVDLYLWSYLPAFNVADLVINVTILRYIYDKIAVTNGE